MPTALSERQTRILEVIRGFIAEHHYPPSHRDIMRMADISSTSVVSYNLRRLRDFDLVELSDTYGRALRLIGPGSPSYEIMVPLIGEMRVDRLLPHYTGEASWPTVAVAASSIQGASEHIFAVCVRGSAFWDVSLAEEDIVLIDGIASPLDPDATYAVWRPDYRETAIVLGRDIGDAEIQGRLCGMMRVW